MLLIDLEQGRIVSDDEIKQQLSDAHPYKDWLKRTQIVLEDLKPVQARESRTDVSLLDRQQAFGYTAEDLKLLMQPMAVTGQEAVGSMGSDTPISALSDKSKLLYTYFKQNFAQVTNPPIDPIREELVMSLVSFIGPRPNILDLEGTSRRKRLEVRQPILTNEDLEKIRCIGHFEDRFDTKTLDITYDAELGAAALDGALDRLCDRAEAAVHGGYNIIILTDRMVGPDRIPIPALLATAAVHNYLIRKGLRTSVGLVVESGEPREIHHFACLAGYGAEAINPYLAFETIAAMHEAGELPQEVDAGEAIKRYIKSIGKGLLKVMSKMGISTYQSYCGAQIFDAIGLKSEFVNRDFFGTATLIEGIGMDEVAEENVRRHRDAFGRRADLSDRPRRGRRIRLPHPRRGPCLEPGHGGDPPARGAPQRGGPLPRVRQARERAGERAQDHPRPLPHQARARDRTRARCAGRGGIRPEHRAALLHGRHVLRVDLQGGARDPCHRHERHRRQVQHRRGRRGAGALPAPAQWALQALGHQAGGLRPLRVTTEYLVNSDMMQIKVAQGPSPARAASCPATRWTPRSPACATPRPGVGLISPPPHHDIYSIEDLAQLIFDLKNVNPSADVSVKLVSEVGVGTVAAGVAKARADHITISGFEGGTGASPLTSLKHAGSPWELGLAETQQTLVLNRLRGRVALQADGGLRTGRDVVIAALLGADEYGFSTAPLIAAGCIMMRKCHLNTCPVGVATQDPVLRKRFKGLPEHVINYFFFVAEEVRELMAEMGFKTVDEMIGQSDILDKNGAIDHWKAKGLDFSRLFHKPDAGPDVAIRHLERQAHPIADVLDRRLIVEAMPALERGERVEIAQSIGNADRTTGRHALGRGRQALRPRGPARRHDQRAPHRHRRSRASAPGSPPA
jgi:glutamate synthase (NADPH/NADH) large chain